MPELIDVTPGSPDWLAARRAGVTATDIVTILGLSTWDSPYSLYWRKLGQVPETADNDRFRLGRELESYVARRWQEATGRGEPLPGGLYRHSGRAWQMATLDYYWGDGVSYEPMLLEVKTWADADRHSWADAPPATVRAQVLWQMDVMDVAVGHVGVVFLPSGEFRSYTIQHEPGCQLLDVVPCDICKDQVLMQRAGVEFMARLRLELPAPDPDASAATLAAVRARFARQPDKTAEVDGTLYAAWTDTKDLVSHYETNIRGYESELREQAGEASVLTVDGQPVARRVIKEYDVRAHHRRSDYLMRIKTEADSE